MILNSLFRPFYWITITCYTKTVTLKVYFYCFCCNSLVLWLLLYHFYRMFYISIPLADSLKSFLVYFSTVTFIVSIVISYQFSSNVNPEHCIYSHSKRFPDYAPKCFCKWFLLKNHRAKKGLESLKKEKKLFCQVFFIWVDLNGKKNLSKRGRNELRFLKCSSWFWHCCEHSLEDFSNSDPTCCLTADGALSSLWYN